MTTPTTPIPTTAPITTPQTTPTLTTTVATPLPHKQSGSDGMMLLKRMNYVMRVPMAVNAGMYLPKTFGLYVKLKTSTIPRICGEAL